jgi:hypothetical protein
MQAWPSRENVAQKKRLPREHERITDLVVCILGLLVVEARGLLVVTRLGVQGRSLFLSQPRKKCH